MDILGGIKVIEIKGYTIGEILHKGRVAIVCRGIRENDNTPVIIKFLKDEYAYSPLEIAKLKYEFEINNKVEDAGIVKMYAMEEYKGAPVLIKEDIGGQSLQNHLKDNTITLESFFEIVIKLTDAVEKIHEKNIIHKDLNPNNIIINPETGRIAITDFGISTILLMENQNSQNMNTLEGTLQYISPEQTGRMNRKIDYHSDFYSLGVTFYKIISGQLPFESRDDLELIHCHLAKQPVPLHELDKNIPETLSNIVMRLMEKEVQDRYQSIAGLKYDLKKCMEMLREKGVIEFFQIGKMDKSNRFQIVQKLYGREKEIEILINTFKQSIEGGVEVILVSGHSGIGKTSLVKEIHKPVIENNGYYLSGKFDQYKRNMPYYAFIRAFQELIKQLLTESQSEIDNWRNRFIESLGGNAQVIIEVIPELEAIVGKQPDVIELPPIEAQNRFNLTFIKFINAFASIEHPLVIFLDDLQWADLPSLNLIKTMVTDSEIGKILVIGAYRDNEVDEAHPLVLTIKDILKTGKALGELKLKPLEIDHVNSLLEDTLKCKEEYSMPLAKLCYKKTLGNPFFLNQLLNLLYHDDLIRFNKNTSEWEWDIDEIENTKVTDNVVDLMIGKIKKLNENTQEILKFASCIGNIFDLKTLEMVSEKEHTRVSDALWEALKEELIEPMGIDYKFIYESSDKEFAYKFVHDRIQQAAYSLMEDQIKNEVHYSIGKLMLENIPEKEQDEKLFDIVNHLNFGIQLIEKQEERDGLAELNLAAGKKAKASVAFEPAYTCFKTGMELAGEDIWERNYSLALDLFVETANIECILGKYEVMEQTADVALKNCKTILDKFRIYKIMIIAYTIQYKLTESLKLSLYVLKQLNVNITEKAGNVDILKGLIGTKLTLGRKKIENLVQLPEMTDPYKSASLMILQDAVTTTYLASPNHVPLVAFEMVNLSIKYGNHLCSSTGYSTYGLILCGVIGDIETGYKFGKLAMELQEKGFNTTTGRVLILFNSFIRHWKEPIKNSFQSMRDGYSSLINIGDFEIAAYLITNYCCMYSYVGQELSELERELIVYSNACKKMNIMTMANVIDIYIQNISNLRGEAEDCTKLVGKIYDENIMIPEHIKTKNTFATFCAYLAKLTLCYSFGKIDEAIENADTAEKYIDGAVGSVPVPIYHFYSTLARIEMLDAHENTKSLKKKISSSLKKMKKWANYAPMNYMNKYCLMNAEYCRVCKEYSKAEEYYDKAIQLSGENGFIQEEALANELASRYYFSKGKTKFAVTYLEDAYRGYKKWGAIAKIQYMEEKYPEMFLSNVNAPITVSKSTSSTTNTMELLNMTSILKATQTISREIVLERLLEKLVNITMENAGAQRIFFIVKRDEDLFIEARGDVSETNQVIIESCPVIGSGLVPESIINYVNRTKENIVLDEASTNEEAEKFLKDPYIVQYKPKSVLCAPVINRGILAGILYLENNLLKGAFTEDRISILNVLTAQIAISLENADLYNNMDELVKTRTKEIKNLLDNTGEGFLSFGKDLKIDDQYSLECKEIFDEFIEGKKFSDLIGKDISNDVIQNMEKIFKSIFETEDGYKASVLISILPNEIKINGKDIQIEYKLINVIKQSKIMIILTDITEKKKLRREMEEERKYLRMIVRVVINRNDVKDSIEQYMGFSHKSVYELLEKAEMVSDFLTDFYRIIHTYKGEFAQWNMFNTVEYLHDLESSISQRIKQSQNESKEILLEFLHELNLEEFLNKDLELLSKTLGNTFVTGEEEVFTISKSKILELESKVSLIMPSNEAREILTSLKKLRYYNLKDSINAYGEYLMDLALRLNKKLENFKVTGEDILIDKDIYSPTLKSLLHIFKNMIDHGIESPEERVEEGKNEEGRIECHIQWSKPDQISISIKDDGRGIDFDAIRKTALEKGLGTKDELANASEGKILDFIFKDTFSTKKTITNISGRGVGLSAVKAEVERLGGQIEVYTKTGEGTEFRILLPYLDGNN